MHLQIKWHQILVGSVSGRARFQKTLFHRVGSGPSQPLHPLNRPKTNRMHPQIVPTRVGSDRVGSNPGWIRLGSGPFSKSTKKSKGMFDNFIESDRPNTGRMHPQIDRKQVGCTPKLVQNGSFAPASRPRHGRIRPSRPEFGSDPALDGSIFKLHCKTRVILHVPRAWNRAQPIGNHRKSRPYRSKRYQFTNPLY